MASGDLYRASSVTGLRPALNSESVSLGDAMAFSGPGPERINGRLSMLAVVAALGAELSSHETVVKQLSEQPTLIVLAAVLVAAGSLVPLLEGKSVEQQSKGFWNAAAEQTNGRAASACPLRLSGFVCTCGLRAACVFPRSDWLRLAAGHREAGGPRAAVSAAARLRPRVAGDACGPHTLVFVRHLHYAERFLSSALAF